jgi:hypothetical protein
LLKREGLPSQTCENMKNSCAEMRTWRSALRRSLWERILFVCLH